ncbi:helix-turn-helix transcriptional regulator [Streptomyces olivaceoviridis]|uniref:helix-turn-helix transcriptional regulator n=1 Tax=Streptomyces olivaceoviridis TaxID=1921 RepID=UPI0036FAAF7F
MPSWPIGREPEFAQLTALIDAAREGHGASALVHGEAGIGKSRPASAVVEAASSAGFTVLSCHGIRGAGAAGFEGLHELLLPLLDRIDALPPRRRMALKVTFGAEGEPADRFITGLAAFTVLTAQELHVARLAAQGYTNRQIADQLYLSHRTVGAHLYKVYAKSQINRRSQLATALASDTLD